MARFRHALEEVGPVLRSKRFWAYTIGVYLIFYAGGHWSFSYTHECVRSHTELGEVPDPAHGDVREGEVTVCDWYDANGKR